VIAARLPWAYSNGLLLLNQKMSNPNSKVQLTLTGYQQLVQELEDLKNNKLPAAIDRVARAREFGDLSENYEYQSSKEDHAALMGRIDELTEILNHSEVIKAANANGSVGLGSSVLVEVNGTEHEFTIVGEWEADPASKRISHESPLGKALVGKTVGENVEIEAPAGKVVYTLKAIK